MNKKDVLLYLRTNSKTENEQILSLVEDAIKTVVKTAKPKTLYRIFDCEIFNGKTVIDGVEFKSVRLAENLAGCKKVALLGATLGIEIDRLIKTAGANDIAKAMAYQAAASVLIEDVCDGVEDEIKNALGVKLRRRYSPGYFDLDITQQKNLFSLIDITKRIGLTLTDSCEMIPTKSVTAFIGIED